MLLFLFIVATKVFSTIQPFAATAIPSSSLGIAPRMRERLRRVLLPEIEKGIGGETAVIKASV